MRAEAGGRHLSRGQPAHVGRLQHLVRSEVNAQERNIQKSEFESKYGQIGGIETNACMPRVRQDLVIPGIDPLLILVGSFFRNIDRTIEQR